MDVREFPPSGDAEGQACGPAKMRWLNLRNMLFYFWGGLVLLGLYFTDVDNGVQTTLMLGGLASGIIAVFLAHVSRKGLMHYPEADMQSLFHIIKSAPDSNAGKPIGAGLALVAIAIVLNGLFSLFGPRAHAATRFDVARDVPTQAAQYMPILKAHLDREWRKHPKRGMVAALYEHESGCMALPRMCWSVKARLKTSREEGATFIQITRAYRADGSTRFDALQEMAAKYPQLRGWNWGNVYDRPDLALLAGVLKQRDSFEAFSRTVKDPIVAVLFTDLGYNEGDGRVQADRRACGLKSGCDPQKYWGNVEKTCTASKAPLYGQRSPCDISRNHVRDVWLRSDKYQRYL